MVATRGKLSQSSDYMVIFNEFNDIFDIGILLALVILYVICVHF